MTMSPPMTILLRSRIYSVHLPDEILRDLICYPEEPHALLFGVGLLVLGLERFIVDLGAGPQFVLCIGEEIVRAVADKVGAADLGIFYGELWRALVGTADELLLAHDFDC